LGFVLVQVRGLFLEVVVLVVGLKSLQVVRLLGILPLEFTTGMGGVVDLRRRGGTVHGFSVMVLVLLQAERGGSLRVVTMVVFVEVVLVGEMLWLVLTPLSSKWLGTGFTLLVLTPVLSPLFAHVLVFEFQVIMSLARRSFRRRSMNMERMKMAVWCPRLNMYPLLLLR
jgi:hypothetical protein